MEAAVSIGVLPEARGAEESGAFEALTGLVGRHPALLEAVRRLRRFAACDASVLITGETGTGKELFAHALHQASSRNCVTMITVNCAQFQDGQLAVSELFGYRKGSYTGAASDYAGYFRAAHNGVLFLDEIGELPAHAQAILLRALGEGEVTPLGESRPIRVDVRVISATNRLSDPRSDDAGVRRDLLYRVRTCEVHIPPLRDRGDDALLIARQQLRRLNHRTGASVTLTSGAEHAILLRRWPGNVRELLAAVESAFYSRRRETIHESDLPADVRPPSPVDVARRQPDGGIEDFWTHIHGPYLDRELSRADVQAIVARKLADAGGNYRRFLQSVGVSGCQYFKAMDFLRHHGLKPQLPGVGAIRSASQG